MTEAPDTTRARRWAQDKLDRLRAVGPYGDEAVIENLIASLDWIDAASGAVPDIRELISYVQGGSAWDMAEPAALRLDRLLGAES